MPVTQVDLQYSTRTPVYLKASSQLATISTRRLTWRGSLYTWQLQQPAEEALLQGELDAAKTKWWWGTLQIWKPAGRFAPRALILTVMVKFLSTDGSVRLLRMERLLAPSTTTPVINLLTEEVRRPAPTKVSWAPPFTSASVAAESSLQIINSDVKMTRWKRNKI